MATPLHADHLQPSDVPAVLDVLRTTPIIGVLGDVAGAANGTLVAAYKAPCAGILEDPFIILTTPPGSGTMTVNVRKNGSSVLSATMDVASGASGAALTVHGAFSSDAAKTVAQGDIIAITVDATGTGSTFNLSAAVSFKALGRTA